jgi:hypothetical protein
MVGKVADQSDAMRTIPQILELEFYLFMHFTKLKIPRSKALAWCFWRFSHCFSTPSDEVVCDMGKFMGVQNTNACIMPTLYRIGR